ncbi:MAG: HPr kinase/phosphorylase, partial [Pygmaiobacter sp.]
MEFKVSLAKLVDELKMEVIYTPIPIEEVMVTNADVNRPGLMLAGFYEYFDPSRLQILGKVEMSFLDGLDKQDRNQRLHTFIATKPTAIVLSRDLTAYPEMMEYVKEFGVPLLESSENTSALMSAIISIL